MAIRPSDAISRSTSRLVCLGSTTAATPLAVAATPTQPHFVLKIFRFIFV
jgi:hypothetical protein